MSIVDVMLAGFVLLFLVDGFLYWLVRFARARFQ